MLAFGSEILLWTHPAGRTLPDWVILAAGYLALSAVLLDLAVRYRVRDLFGLMTLAGIYGLAAGLLLNPQTALVDVPRTLITRVMGAHTLVGLAMMAVFLKGADFHRFALVIVGAVGLGWGIWVRWLPALVDAPETPLMTMMLYGVGAFILVTTLFWFNRAGSYSSRLSWLEGGIAAAVLAAIFITRLNAVDSLSMIVIAVLIAFCVMLLWFQKREKGATLLAQLPVGRVPVTAALLFLAAGAAGYSLPFSADGEQLALMVGLFTAFGLVWLPTVSLVMGVRAYRKLTRTGRL